MSNIAADTAPIMMEQNETADDTDNDLREGMQGLRKGDLGKRSILKDYFCGGTFAHN